VGYRVMQKTRLIEKSETTGVFSTLTGRECNRFEFIIYLTFFCIVARIDIF
jgi:hypothetical protein